MVFLFDIGLLLSIIGVVTVIAALISLFLVVFTRNQKQKKYALYALMYGSIALLVSFALCTAGLSGGKL